MQRLVLFLFMLLLVRDRGIGQPFKSYTPTSKGISVGFYKNVEFLGFVFFLGSQYMGDTYENDESLVSSGIKKKDWHAYDLSLYRKYKSFKGNTNLSVGTRFAENLEGAYMIHFLLDMPEFPNASLPATMPLERYIGFSEKKDSAEARKNAELFIQAMNGFHREIGFDNYYREHDHLYEQALKEIRSKLPSHKLILAMEKFYRRSFDRYCLLPSLTLPAGMAFGISRTADEKVHIFNAFGPYALQQFINEPINMGFADEKHIRELSVHEFGHSFSNPAVAKVPVALVNETSRLFDTIRTAMENQGYNTWMSCLHEHFVRAGEVIIAKNSGRVKDSKALRSHYINGRKFIYLPLVIEELERYDKDKNSSYEQAVIRAIERLIRL